MFPSGNDIDGHLRLEDRNVRVGEHPVGQRTLDRATRCIRHVDDTPMAMTAFAC